jgi:MFS family permease
MRDAYSATLESSAYWTTVFFVGLFVGRILFTFVKVPLVIRTQLLLGLFASAAAFSLSLWVSPWFFVAVGISMAPCYALIMSWMRERAQDSLRMATTAAIVSSGVFIVAMHLLAGFVTDLYGVAMALWGGVIFLFISALLVLLDRYLLAAFPEHT